MTRTWLVAPKVSRRSFTVGLGAVALGMGATTLFAAPAGKQLVYGYVTPGPDTWYKRDVDGFVYAAGLAGAKVIVLNSDYNAEKEIANIDSLINQGVDGMCIFTFNPNGANIAAKKCAAAGIPLVVTDNVGQVLKSGSDVVAAIDFDWNAMGKDVAQNIAQNYPGENVAVIMGLFEHIPVQMFRASFEPAVAQLGKNKIVAVRDGRYDPNEAVNQAQDLIQSGQKFSVLFVFNDEMGVAVVRMLKTSDLLNNPIKVITTNGAPYGIEPMKHGAIKYSISSSPGWEGMISFLALQAYVPGKITTKNQQNPSPHRADHADDHRRQDQGDPLGSRPDVARPDKDELPAVHGAVLSRLRAGPSPRRRPFTTRRKSTASTRRSTTSPSSSPKGKSTAWSAKTARASRPSPRSCPARSPPSRARSSCTGPPTAASRRASRSSSASPRSTRSPS